MDSRLWGLQKFQFVGSVVVVPELYSTGPTVLAHGLSCFAACVIFSDQGSSPALAGKFFTTEPPGKPRETDFKLCW